MYVRDRGVCAKEQCQRGLHFAEISYAPAPRYSSEQKLLTVCTRSEKLPQEISHKIKLSQQLLARRRWSPWLLYGSDYPWRVQYPIVYHSLVTWLFEHFRVRNTKLDDLWVMTVALQSKYNSDRYDIISWWHMLPQ